MEQHKVIDVVESILHRSEIDCTPLQDDLIRKEIFEGDQIYSNITIKVLTIFGALVSAGFFALFLGISGVFNSSEGLITIGMISLIAAFLLFKLNRTLFWTSVGVMLSIVGHGSVLVSFLEANMNVNTIALLFIGLSILLLFFAENFIQKMLSFVVIIIAIMAITLELNIFGIIPVLSGFMAIVLTYLTTQESVLIARLNKKWNELYAPVKMGATISFAMLIIGGAVNWFSREENFNIPYVGSFLILICLGFILWKVFQKFEINNAPIYLIGVIILFLPMINNPAIIGSFFLLILGFYAGNRIELGMGLIGGIYFISRFYYDLDWTLLTKSYMMMGMGLLFLLGYWIFNYKLSTNEI